MSVGHDGLDVGDAFGVVLVKMVGVGLRLTSTVADEDFRPRAAQSNPPARIVMSVQLIVFAMLFENML